MPSIRACIFGEWLSGASETNLADRHETRVEFIRAVFRSEARRQHAALFAAQEQIAVLRNALHEARGRKAA